MATHTMCQGLPADTRSWKEARIGFSPGTYRHLDFSPPSKVVISHLSWCPECKIINLCWYAVTAAIGNECSPSAHPNYGPFKEACYLSIQSHSRCGLGVLGLGVDMPGQTDKYLCFRTDLQSQRRASQRGEPEASFIPGRLWLQLFT